MGWNGMLNQEHIPPGAKRGGGGDGAELIVLFPKKS